MSNFINLCETVILKHISRHSGLEIKTCPFFVILVQRTLFCLLGQLHNRRTLTLKDVPTAPYWICQLPHLLYCMTKWPKWHIDYWDNWLKPFLAAIGLYGLKKSVVTLMVIVFINQSFFLYLQEGTATMHRWGEVCYPKRTNKEVQFPFHIFVTCNLLHWFTVQHELAILKSKQFHLTHEQLGANWLSMTHFQLYFTTLFGKQYSDKLLYIYPRFHSFDTNGSKLNITYN